MTALTDILSLPQTELAVAANEFAIDVSPEFVYNHCVRSYLFARAVVQAQGLPPGSPYDDELVFLSCILHDLGVTSVANGDQRFEVDGADAAAMFLRDRDVDESRIKVVWNAVALHTSAGLAHRFGPVEAVSQMGISIDIMGLQKDSLPAGFADVVHTRWPRHDLGYALSAAIANQVEANPGKGIPLTFPGHVHQLLYPSSHPITWFDLVDAAGWGDRPATDPNDVDVAHRPEDLSALFERYFAAADLDALMSLYDPAAVFAPAPGTTVSGHAAIRDALASQVGSGAALSLTTRRVQLLDDVAYISSTARMQLDAPGAEVIETTTTEIARRHRDGRWLYIFDDPFSTA